MNKTGLTPNWSDWRVVCSESHLVSALKRGYFMPPSLDAYADLGGGHQGLILVRRTEVLRRSEEVRDVTGELGQPVSVRWRVDYLAAVLPELASNNGNRVELVKGLALYSGGIRIGFAKRGRRDGILAFLENAQLAEALLPEEEVDPELSKPAGYVHKPGGKSRRKSDSSSRKQSETLPEMADALGGESLFEFSEEQKIWNHNPISFSPKILEELKREERLQCATELALEIAEDPVQLDFAASLARAERESWSGVGEDLRALCEYRVSRGGKNRRPIAKIAAHVHQLDQERRNSPMINSEKIELLRLAINGKWGVSGQDLDHLSEVLTLVKADDSLGSLNLSKMSSWVQGVVLFLLHSASPQEVIGMSRTYFQVSAEAMSIAAFLVGLRFARDSYNPDHVFMPLRDLHVRSAIETLNDCVDDEKNLSITVQSDSIKFGENKFVPARAMLVFDLGIGRVFVEDAQSGSCRLAAARIVIPAGAQIPKVKFQVIEDWKSEILTSPVGELQSNFNNLVMGSVPRTKNKKRVLDFLVNFTDSEKMFTKYQVAMLQFKGLVWVIDSSGSCRRFLSPKLRIREEKLVEILNLASQISEGTVDKVKRRELERDIRKQLPKRFLERRERLVIPEQ